MYLENNRRRRPAVGPIISWILVVLWMAVIFFLSAQDGTQSGSLSGSIAAVLYPLLSGRQDPEGQLAFESVLRTLAHGGFYFILALLVCLALVKSRVRDIGSMVVTFLICAVYAASDEIHQAYVPGRASDWVDFLVDMAGVIIGIVLFHVISALRYLNRQRKAANTSEYLKI